MSAMEASAWLLRGHAPSYGRAEEAHDGGMAPGEADCESGEEPLLSGGGEAQVEWAALPNLDVFFSRVYRYWQGRGLTAIFISGLLNVLALGFTISFSAFLLLFVNWSALHAECIVKDTCDIASVAINTQPLRGRGIFADLIILMYLAIFGLYWAWTAIHFVTELREMLETRHFFNNTLGVSERQVGTMTWAEVVHRIVLVQRTKRLCISRDLNEHDIIGRIMRKDNYLIAMVNKGVVSPYLPLPRWLGLGRRRAMLTKTLEWNLRWAMLDRMFDERTFCVRRDFLADPSKLQARLRTAAAANLVLSPFLFVFLLIYFFMHNAERFYSHPGSLGSRRWSALAKWTLRELNEAPHYVSHRLAASHAPASRYLSQFPSHMLASLARFVAFVTGSFAALLLLLTALDETLLERPLFGRHLVWWLAAIGIVLTASRGLVADDPVAYDPEAAMTELSAVTHYMPRAWRGKTHTPEVQGQLSGMFQLKVLMFLEEMASVLLTPYVLYFVLPEAAPGIVAFVRDFTTEVDGVGHICSFAAFDVAAHGNAKYGAPTHAPKARRSRQGKLEKSLLTFVATYPTWEPPPDAAEMLVAMDACAASGGAPVAQHLALAAAAAAAAHAPRASPQHVYSHLGHYGHHAAHQPYDGNGLGGGGGRDSGYVDAGGGASTYPAAAAAAPPPNEHHHQPYCHPEQRHHLNMGAAHAHRLAVAYGPGGGYYGSYRGGGGVGGAGYGGAGQPLVASAPPAVPASAATRFASEEAAAAAPAVYSVQYAQCPGRGVEGAAPALAGVGRGAAGGAGAGGGQQQQQRQQLQPSSVGDSFVFEPASAAGAGAGAAAASSSGSSHVLNVSLWHAVAPPPVAGGDYGALSTASAAEALSGDLGGPLDHGGDGAGGAQRSDGAGGCGGGAGPRQCDDAGGRVSSWGLHSGGGGGAGSGRSRSPDLGDLGFALDDDGDGVGAFFAAHGRGGGDLGFAPDGDGVGAAGSGGAVAGVGGGGSGGGDSGSAGGSGTSAPSSGGGPLGVMMAASASSSGSGSGQGGGSGRTRWATMASAVGSGGGGSKCSGAGSRLGLADSVVLVLGNDSDGAAADGAAAERGSSGVIDRDASYVPGGRDGDGRHPSDHYDLASTARGSSGAVDRDASYVAGDGDRDGDGRHPSDHYDLASTAHASLVHDGYAHDRNGYQNLVPAAAHASLIHHDGNGSGYQDLVPATAHSSLIRHDGHGDGNGYQDLVPATAHSSLIHHDGHGNGNGYAGLIPSAAHASLIISDAGDRREYPDIPGTAHGSLVHPGHGRQGGAGGGGGTAADAFWLPPPPRPGQQQQQEHLQQQRLQQQQQEHLQQHVQQRLGSHARACPPGASPGEDEGVPPAPSPDDPARHYNHYSNPGGASANGAWQTQHLQQQHHGPDSAAPAGPGPGSSGAWQHWHDSRLQPHQHHHQSGAGGSPGGAGAWHWHDAQHQPHHQSGAGDAATTTALLRASVLGLPTSAAAIDQLPANETLELARRLSLGHRLLQSLYVASEPSVQHRQVQAAAARSIMHSRASGGGGGGSGRASVRATGDHHLGAPGAAPMDGGAGQPGGALHPGSASACYTSPSAMQEGSMGADARAGQPGAATASRSGSAWYASPRAMQEEGAVDGGAGGARHSAGHFGSASAWFTSPPPPAQESHLAAAAARARAAPLASSQVLGGPSGRPPPHAPLGQRRGNGGGGWGTASTPGRGSAVLGGGTTGGAPSEGATPSHLGGVAHSVAAAVAAAAAAAHLFRSSSAASGGHSSGANGGERGGAMRHAGAASVVPAHAAAVSGIELKEAAPNALHGVGHIESPEPMVRRRL
ncbi:hypothetical protein FOA52_015585 [Chlamydomonas sp. UWO 241]|nr:hypothetical protein FOA52_015585 [Chlamydomonas sp. UWO 241]